MTKNCRLRRTPVPSLLGEICQLVRTVSVLSLELSPGCRLHPFTPLPSAPNSQHEVMERSEHVLKAHTGSLCWVCSRLLPSGYFASFMVLGMCRAGGSGWGVLHGSASRLSSIDKRYVSVCSTTVGWGSLSSLLPVPWMQVVCLQGFNYFEETCRFECNYLGSVVGRSTKATGLLPCWDAWDVV